MVAADARARLRGLIGLAVLLALMVLGPTTGRAAPGEGQGEVEAGPEVASEPEQAQGEPARGVSRRRARQAAADLGEALSSSTEAWRQSARERLVWRATRVGWPLAPLTELDPDADIHGAQLDASEALGEAEPAATLRPRVDLQPLLEQRAAMVGGFMPVPTVQGPVSIDADRAINVWIASLETVRVRRVSGAGTLRFVRIVDAHTAVVEQGRALDPGPDGEPRWELSQPPADGAVWSIEAEGEATVVVERAVVRTPRYSAVEVEAQLLAWIEEGRSPATMPRVLEPDDDLEAQLHLEAELGRELLKLDAADGVRDPHLEKAVVAWRQLSAMQGVDAGRLPVRPYFVGRRGRVHPVKLSDTSPRRLDTDDSRDYRLAELEAHGARRWTVRRRGTRSGPGVLYVDGRAWAPEGEALRDAELRVSAGGRVLQRISLSRRPARHSVDPDTAFPQFEALVDESGHAVGEFATMAVPLAPGRREYTIELVGGPAMVAVREALRVEATGPGARRETPRGRLRHAHRQLERSESETDPWLAALIAESEHERVQVGAGAPELEALGESSPALALAILATLAEDPALDRRQTRVLGEQAAQWLSALSADPDFDPTARGQLRARWITIAAIHGDRQLARLLVDAGTGTGSDPIHELPLEGLRVLAELLAPAQGTVRSPALALLELARRRAPTDEAIRGQLLYLWKDYTRWSKRRPISEVDTSLVPRGEWLVPRKGAPGLSDAGEREASWLRLSPGRVERVQAEIGGGLISRQLGVERVRNPRRMRLLDIYVASPVDRVEPVRLRVDDSVWWSPQLASVVRHRVAVPEGNHELQLDGPLGTIAWAELPPEEPIEDIDPERLGRRERLHDLSKVSWVLPGPQVPGYARLELRWPEDVPPQRTVIHIHQDGVEGTQTVLFDPRTRIGTDEQGEGIWDLEIDADATPIGPSPRAGQRHGVAFAVAARTRRVWFEVEGEVALAGGLSIRRALRPRELLDDDGGLVPVEVVHEEDLLGSVFAELTALDSEALIEELARLSRALLVSPDSIDERARRAALLLMLGETGYARADLVRLSAWAEREDVSLLRRDRAKGVLAELEDRFSALIDPREIIVEDANDARAPILVEPAIAAVVGPRRELLEPWLPLWSLGRAENPGEALERLARAQRRQQGMASDDGEVEAAPEPEGERSVEAAAAEDAELLDAELVARLLPDLTRATWLSLEGGRARTAARVWLELYGHMRGELGAAREPLAVGLAAVPALLEHLDDPGSDARDAGLAFGLGRELEPRYGHTSVRSLAFIAALRSDWRTVSHTEHAPGFERLELPVEELLPSQTARVREALLVTPWAGDDGRGQEMVRPGRKGVLAWDAEVGVVDLELWCRAARPDLDPSRAERSSNPRALGTAKLGVALRSGDDLRTRREVEVGDGTVARVSLPVESASRHRLEVVLGEDPIWLCAWRGVARPGAELAEVEREQALVGEGTETSEFVHGGEREAIETRRRARWWTVERESAVEFVVLGPTSVDVEARAVAAGDVTSPGLIAEVEPLRPRADAPGPSEGKLPLSPQVERSVMTERRRAFAVTEAVSHILLITEPGPHRVRLRTRSGRAVVRARLRRDRPKDDPPARVSLGELLNEVNEPESVLTWRGVGPGLAIAAAEPHGPVRNRIGSFDGRIVVGLDDLGDVDDLRPRLGGMVTAGWRRELVENRLWIFAAAQTAVRNASPISSGVRLRLAGRSRRAGLRMGAEFDSLAGPWYTGLEGSIRGEAFIDRPTWLGPFLQLRPGLKGALRWQSLNRGGANIGGPGFDFEPHPRVFLPYVRDHPIVVEPELELRAFPLQDLALYTEGSVVFNSDFASLDRVDIDLGALGIVRQPSPWVPTWGVAYQASLRLADAHRSSFFVRHTLGARLGVGVWARDSMRVTFGVGDRLYLIGSQRPRNVFELWLRFDGVFGRRLRDYGPQELWFSEPWAPRAWGDHAHQAESTLAPVRGHVRSQASR